MAPGGRAARGGSGALRRRLAERQGRRVGEGGGTGVAATGDAASAPCATPAPAGHRRRSAGRAGIEQADELRLEGRAIAVGQPAAQGQRRGDRLRSRLRLEALQRRRRESRGPSTRRPRARACGTAPRRTPRIAARDASGRRRQGDGEEQAARLNASDRQRSASRAGDPATSMAASGARAGARTASACAACNAWCRGRICAPRPRSGRGRTP